MSHADESLRRDYHHPYKPYDIQTQFMDALYDCIEDGKVGIFESPTGTGKSLSLICGSLTWLRDHKRRDFDRQLNAVAKDENEPAWMVEHAQKQKREELRSRRKDVEARLARIRVREKKQRERFENGEPWSKRMKADQDNSATEDDVDAQFLLDDYESDEDGARTPTGTVAEGLSSETQELIKKLGMDPGKTEEEDVAVEDELKIFYCSRTHSQLSQFVNELRRLDLPPAFPPDVPERDPSPADAKLDEEGLKHLTLGSRKNLCINPKVSRLGSVTAINERCLELQRPGTTRDKKCPHLPNKENEALVNDFRDHTLAKIRDIEDLAVLGKKLGICPYYASRPTIKPSEIVTLPYPLLLQKSAREALSLSLKGHVVIIDEAHNLMDAISNIHSSSVSLGQLKRSRTQLGAYLQRFRNRLKGKNRVYVTQIVRLIDSLAGCLESRYGKPDARDGIAAIGELMSGKGVDQINLYKLMHYLRESKLARKVDGFALRLKVDTSAKQMGTSSSDRRKGPSKPLTSATSTPVLTHLENFLLTLTNPSAEGRIFYHVSDDNDISLRYTLLDPTHHFEEIVAQARAVVLAGGTMSPMSEYTEHLFAYVDPQRIQTLSCGHVIPPENLVALVVPKGANGREFEFTFEKRNSASLIEELGETIVRLCATVPDGVVVFFPNYAYLAQVVQQWERKHSNQSASIWGRLCQQKRVFRESKEKASAEDILSDYSQIIHDGKGGLLLSVIGGKMSEGINFSDKLGRNVTIVGLPFPNIHSPEWKAKIEYIEAATYARSTGTSSAAGASLSEASRRAQVKAAGREHYENACMRAVNQSIGRAIRHQNDYASILLLDKRYDNERISSKLPGWIKKGMVKGGGQRSLTEVMASLKTFYASKENVR